MILIKAIKGNTMRRVKKIGNMFKPINHVELNIVNVKSRIYYLKHIDEVEDYKEGYYEMSTHYNGYKVTIKKFVKLYINIDRIKIIYTKCNKFKKQVSEGNNDG